MALQEENGNRKRKAHTKSRQGCRNCKLRRIKCDETRPQCKKCGEFGVSCNYNSKAEDLHVSFDAVVSLDNPQKELEQAPQASQALIGTPSLPYPVVSDILSTFSLDCENMARLGRFRTRTVLTLGTAKTRKLYQVETVNLSLGYPYLMHVVQTLTAMHDRFLFDSSRSHPTVPEIYHWTQAVSLFNRKLSEPIKAVDRDSLWATAALLGAIAFSSIDATTPEEAWPLKPSETSDLDWLMMSEGKRAIWIVTNPLRPDSVFHSLGEEFDDTYYSNNLFASGIDGIPTAFVKLYDLDTSSTAKTSPYHVAVRIVTDTFDLPGTQENIVKFFKFSSHMQPEFFSLMANKDPRALLLVAYWYAKIRNAIWWVHRRATLEGQAACLYLERWYPYNTALLELLHFPKQQLGLVS